MSKTIHLTRAVAGKILRDWRKSFAAEHRSNRLINATTAGYDPEQDPDHTGRTGRHTRRALHRRVLKHMNDDRRAFNRAVRLAWRSAATSRFHDLAAQFNLPV